MLGAQDAAQQPVDPDAARLNVSVRPKAALNKELPEAVVRGRCCSIADSVIARHETKSAGVDTGRVVRVVRYGVRPAR
jgi:hypothetical protein